MEQSIQSSSQSPWVAHWRTRRICDEGEHNCIHPFDILNKGIKNIEKGICKSANNVYGNSKIAGTSKALKGKQVAFNVDLLQPRNNHDMFNNTSVRGICSDFEVPLPIIDDPKISYSKPRTSVEEDTHILQSDPHFPSSYLRHSECDDFDRNRRSPFLACEKRSHVISKSERCMATCLRDVIASPLQAASSTSKNSSPTFPKIWNFPGTKYVPSSANKLSEKNSLKMPDHEFNTNAKFQSSFNEVETTRICTTVDSVVGLSGRHSRFSQTTHSLLITKKADFNLFKEDQTHTNSRRRADIHSFSKVDRVAPSFRHGVKLQSLYGFTDSGVQEKSKDINGLTKFGSGEENNAEDASDFEDLMHRKGKRAAHDKGLCFDLNSESSAGTDIMDFYNLEKTQGYGVNSSPPVKVIKLCSTTRGLALSSGTEEGGPRRHKTTMLPDMNLEAPISPVEEQMLDYVEPSTSRTQSLDKETVLAHAEQGNPLESANDFGSSLKPEPAGRWLKRLKLSNASVLYSVGTKSSDFTENLHHKRRNLSVERFLKDGMASLKAIASRNHGKELMVLDETTTLKPHRESLYTDSAKKDRDLLLSKSWIRRWCHHEEATPNTNPNPNPNAEMTGEPRSSNILLNGIEKKQFPSLAAMAMMAKAIKCSERYDIRNRGAFVVWSTKGF